MAACVYCASVGRFCSTQRHTCMVPVGELQLVEESFDTLPAGFAGGLDADLDQNILRGAVFSTVVGGHSQLVHALFAIAQLLRVLDET